MKTKFLIQAISIFRHLALCSKLHIAQQRIVIYLLLFGEATKQLNSSNAYTAEILPKISVF